MGKFRICLDSGHTLNCNKGIANGYYEGNVMFTLTSIGKRIENYGKLKYFDKKQILTTHLTRVNGKRFNHYQS